MTTPRPSPVECQRAAIDGLTNWCVNTKRHLDAFARIHAQSLRLPQEFAVHRRWERDLKALVETMGRELIRAEPDLAEYLTTHRDGNWPGTNDYVFLRSFPTEYLESYS